MAMIIITIGLTFKVMEFSPTEIDNSVGKSHSARED